MPSCASHSPSEPHSSPESIKYKQQGYFNRNALLQWFCNVNTFYFKNEAVQKDCICFKMNPACAMSLH